MNMLPIQVTEAGVLIPKIYLLNAGEVEVIVSQDYVLVRPKPSSPELVSAEASVPTPNYDFIGIGHSRDPQASLQAEAILEREIKRESGWSLD